MSIKMTKKYGIDTSHFLGCGWNKGKPSLKRKEAEKILQCLPEGSYRPKRKQLFRAMEEFKIPYKCSECFLENNWNNKPLVLEIDHIDGNFLNNILSNLRFLCPNCHSQQETNKPYKYANVM